MSDVNINFEPAFPGTWMDFQPGTGEQVVRDQWAGMDLRDFFAAQAILGALDNASDSQLQNLARRAYLLADCMMRQRESTKSRTSKAA